MMLDFKYVRTETCESMEEMKWVFYPLVLHIYILHTMLMTAATYHVSCVYSTWANMNNMRSRYMYNIPDWNKTHDLSF